MVLSPFNEALADIDSELPPAPPPPPTDCARTPGACTPRVVIFPDISTTTFPDLPPSPPDPAILAPRVMGLPDLETVRE